ncbi:hypothetical protein D3C71_1608920 [compost metagenome]
MLQKHIDAVQPGGQVPEVHVQPPASVGVAKLGLGRQHVLPSLVDGGFAHENAVAVDMHPRGGGAFGLLNVGPAGNGQATLCKRIDVLGKALQGLAANVTRWWLYFIKRGVVRAQHAVELLNAWELLP